MKSKEFNVVITKEAQHTIDYLHSNVKRDTEWSGVLFYDVDKDILNNPTVTVMGVYPMNIGTHSYTSYGAKDMLSIYEKYPEILEKGYRLGHIHTHHCMDTFFSSVDTNELKDNVDKYPYYLSLIVNYNGKYNAKIALKAKTISTCTFHDGETVRTFEKEGSEIIVLDGHIVSSKDEFLDSLIAKMTKPKVVEYSYTRSINNRSKHSKKVNDFPVASRKDVLTPQTYTKVSNWIKELPVNRIEAHTRIGDALEELKLLKAENADVGSFFRPLEELLMSNLIALEDYGF